MKIILKETDDLTVKKNDNFIKIYDKIDTLWKNRHEYIEIGGVRWATMNIGATGVTDYGLYFQWGDTSGHTADSPYIYSESTYKYYDDSTSEMTKYNNTDGKTVLESTDDAVHAAWGGNWRMPTKDEYVALGNAVNSAWTTNYQDSGVAGLILTDKTDSSKVLFFPAAGCGYDSQVKLIGSRCYYWSGSGSISNINCSYSLIAQNNYWDYKYEYFGRYGGFSIRGVLN